MRRLTGPCALACAAAIAMGLSPRVRGADDPPYSPTKHTLLLDHLDEPAQRDGARYTRTAVSAEGTAQTGARLPKPFEYVPGVFGKALRLHGPHVAVYPGAGHVDLTGGQAEFWVSLNYDPSVRNKKTTSIWRNQFFLTFHGPGPSRVTVYTVLKSLCVGVWNQQRQLIAYRGHRSTWKQGEWHHVRLAWGRKLELWLDGKCVGSMPWHGLFGPVHVTPDQVRLIVGWKNGLESEFAIDEFRILGPSGERRARPPLFTIPRLAQPPTIDGRLADGEWDRAGAATGFVHMLDDRAVADQTTVYAGHDAKHLYLAMECRDPRKRPLVAGTSSRDGKVWLDDAMDAFLQPGLDRFPYYQLITNCQGVRYDSRIDSLDPRRTSVAFNPNTTVRTGSAPGLWTLEMAAPFSELAGLGEPKPGAVWGCNFNRNADSGSAERLSSWAFMQGGWHQPERFGHMRFSGSERSVRLTGLSDLSAGQVRVSVSLTGIEYQPVVRVTAEVLDDNGETVAEMKDKFLDYRSMTFQAPPLTTGRYTLLVQARSDDGQEWLYKRLPFQVVKPFDVSFACYPYQGQAWATANVKGLRGVERVDCVVAQGLGQCTVDEFRDGVGRAAIDIGRMPPGRHKVTARAMGQGGRSLGEVTGEIVVPKKPVWWRSKAGIDHSVPRPWTDVAADGGDVRVWGRTYRCGPGSLPGQIVNQGEAMLARPVAMVLKAGGQSVDVARAPAQTLESPPDRAVREAKLRAGPLEVTCRTTTEFDGMMRCDLDLHAPRPTAVDQLTIEVPIRKPLAHFLMPSSGTHSKPIVTPSEGWRRSFIPLVWLGNDDVGLTWFAESDQGWQPKDDRMIEVVPGQDDTVLRVRMIRKRTLVQGSVRFTFGLMATPVRPMPKNDPFHIPVGYPAANRPWPEFLTYPARGNLSPGRGTLEFWLRPTHKAGGVPRDVVAVNHRTGIRRYGRAILQWVSGNPCRFELVRFVGSEREPTTLIAGPARLAKGRWYHVALTWGDATRLYLDGRLIGQTKEPWGLDSLVDTGQAERWVDGHPARKLRFGGSSEWKRYTWFAYDEIRSSSTVRYTPDAFTPPTAPYRPDEHTLLLDHLECDFRPDGQDAETLAERIAGAMGEVGGVPSYGCRFGEGKFGRGLHVEVAPGRGAKDLIDEWGLTCRTLWQWMESKRLGIVKYGSPPYLFEEPYDPELKDKVAADRKLGVRSVPYFAFYGIGAPTPLSEEFGHEWMRIPKTTTPAPPPKGHHYLSVCCRSGYADYLPAGTAWAMDRFGFAGIYTDGNTLVFPCRNTHHGCGYVATDGSTQLTWPIFATRECFKRIYKIVHQKDPDGLLINHCSYNLFIPVLSFSDIYYTGEHEYYEDLVNNRVRWQGRQWGLYTLLLGASEHIYTPVHYTQALLHGVGVWPHGPYSRNDVMRKTVRLWKTYDAFDTKTAEWIPYYRAEKGMAVPGSEQIKASLYLHRGKKAMLIVGSLSKDVIETTIRLDLAGMGLQARELTATNALTQERIPCDGAALKVRVLPKSFRVVIVGVE